MRLTTKGRYAVTAMLDLALHAQHGPVSLADISERQGISSLIWSSCSPSCAAAAWFPACAARVAATSCRGHGNHPVAQVIDAVNESVDATRCQGLGTVTPVTPV